MDVEAGVMEMPELDTGVEAPEIETQEVETQEQETPDPRQESKDYQSWLKNLRENSPNEKRFINRAKDNESRLYALTQIEPRGIDGIRENYALLDSLQHGELKGPEAIQALQDAVAETEQVDQMLANGDEKLWDLFGDEFNPGLAKLAPSLLNRIQSTDPEGYARAILPHFVEQLKSSDLVRNHNAVVDILEEQPPSWLPADRKEQWWMDKFQKVAQLMGRNSEWLNAQAKKATEAPQQSQQTKAPDRNTELDQRERDLNWNAKVQPNLLNDAKAMFRAEFSPFFKRLKLDAASTTALQNDFLNRLLTKGNQDKTFKSQMDRYYSMKSPDPNAVRNFAKAGLQKHAKSVMQTLIDERYKGFLSAKPKTAPSTQNGNGAAKGPVGSKEFVVGVRPAQEQINFRHPKFADLRHQNKFPLKDGRIAILRG